MVRAYLSCDLSGIAVTSLQQCSGRDTLTSAPAFAFSSSYDDDQIHGRLERDLVVNLICSLLLVVCYVNMQRINASSSRSTRP
jgi:hypothetical protein